MITSKQLSRLLFSYALIFSVLTVQLATPVQAQKSQQPVATAPARNLYTEPIAEIEKAIDQKRQEFGIPGLSLVIVKDNQIIYMKGLGYKNLELKLPVTPKTLFAIGSTS